MPDAPPPSRPLYERWPYPEIPLAASLARMQVWQLHLDWLRSEAGLGPGPAKPRVWVAGCGTWQCYPTAIANPDAEVLGTDISEASLALTKRRLALHRVTNVTLVSHDLDGPAPDGPFDWIECYGVLMNLRDPAAVMRRFADALAPDGVVRLMVYPWFGRRRVFQIARIAQLLGLGYEDDRHPRWLRSLMRGLPADHPLRFTFADYADSANLGGIVDGFLHMSGVSFSAHELFTLADAAGLELAFVMHRPWGDPWRMADTLGLTLDPWATLYALDAWQELKSNFILVLRKKGAAGQGAVRLHPAVNPDAPHGWTDGARLWARRAVGLTLQDRCHADGALTVPRAAYADLIARSRAATLRPDDPLTLFGARPTRTARGFAFPGEAAWRAPRLHLGQKVPNPAWEHQLRAYSLAEAAGLAPTAPEDWVARWEGHANPLEDDETPYGFSPIPTWKAHGPAIQRWLAAPRPPEVSWADACLPDEGGAFRHVRAWADAVHPGLADRDDATLRELHTLTFGYRSLWLSTAR